MKKEWIDDFLALVECGTFSRAAIQRRVTQPAFSRRIRLLEDWLGAELIDRHKQPVQLTPVAQRYIPEFRALLHDMTQLRTRIRAESRGSIRLTFTTQHSLTITHLPTLLQLIDSELEVDIDFNVRSENRDKCVALFMREQADLLLCIEETHDPLRNLTPDVARLQLGTEVFVPISAPCAQGKPLHGQFKQERIKVLAFPPDSHLGRAMESVLSPLMREHTVEIIHESVFLAGVKEMVRAGLGMAWLPLSLIEAELRSGELLNLSPRIATLTMQLGLYRHARSVHAEVIDQIYALLNTHYKHTQNKTPD